MQALTLPRLARDATVFFVRCELFDRDGKRVADNVYWQSQQRDDVGDPRNDDAFELRQVSWADMTPLNSLRRAPLEVTARRAAPGGHGDVTVTLRNTGGQPAFFERVELMSDRDGDEILPIEYSDNYVTVYPGETTEISGTVTGSEHGPNWVRVGGYNSAPTVVPIDQRARR